MATKKAVFYISDKVQEVGYRLFVQEKILNSSLEGAAINEDNKVKVLLEGEMKDIEHFVEDLKKEKPELTKNPTLSKIVYDDSLIVPNAMRSSQALLIGQFGKGVSFLASIDEKLDNLKELPSKFAEVIKDTFKKY